MLNEDSNLVSMERQEARNWKQLSSTMWKAEFKNARALRSPSSAGIPWSCIERIITHAAPSGRVIGEFHPSRDGTSEREACRKIGGCSDIVVTVHTTGTEHARGNDEITSRLNPQISNFSGRGKAVHVPPQSRFEAIRVHRDRVLRTTATIGCFP